jgi:serine/threonine protein kinase
MEDGNDSQRNERFEDDSCWASECPGLDQGRSSVPVRGSGDDGAPRDCPLIVDENKLVPEGSKSGIVGRPVLITDLVGLDVVRELGSSRFGVVRLLRRPTADGFDYFAAKCYHVGSNQDRRRFESLMRPFVELSHPHVMPIAGFISPTKDAGPIILSAYQESGSLEDVFTRVHRKDPPSFWTDAKKVRVIVGVLSGLLYLHSRGIVHGDLKPSDILLGSDDSIFVCDFVTGKLEDSDMKFTVASQVGSPSYSAPEVSGGGDVTMPTSKADVFSFGVILYEILSGQRVFARTLSAALIWRKAQDPRPSARPVIPASVHPVLRSCIQRCWVPDPRRRPTLDELWVILRSAHFGFPEIPIEVIPLSSGG